GSVRARRPVLEGGGRAAGGAPAPTRDPPSRYARRVWIDSLTHSPRVLRFALETFGAERVVLGSDYPFRLGVDDPVAELDPLGLDAVALRRLRHDNARELLRLPPHP